MENINRLFSNSLFFWVVFRRIICEGSFHQKIYTTSHPLCSKKYTLAFCWNKLMTVSLEIDLY